MIETSEILGFLFLSKILNNNFLSKLILLFYFSYISDIITF
jgi:hypothetical protein